MFLSADSLQAISLFIAHFFLVNTFKKNKIKEVLKLSPLKLQFCSMLGVKSATGSPSATVPGAVGHLSFTEILDTSLKVSWSEPSEKNGILTGM